MRGSRRLRVLVSTSTFPVHEGDGTPRFILDLASSMAPHAEVTVLAPDAPGAAARERIGDVNVHRFTYALPRRMQRLALGAGIPDNLRRYRSAQLQVPAFLFAQWIALRRVVREKGIDVVNAHWLVPQALVAANPLLGSRAPALVSQAHGGDVYLLRRLPAGRRIAEHLLARSDRVLLAGSGLRTVLSDLVGHAVDAELRPMGVDVEAFREVATMALPDREVRVLAGYPAGVLLFVGRMIEIKGVVFLLRAMPRLLQAHPGIGLVLIGDGPERAALEVEARELGVAGAVRFLGQRPHREVAALMNRCRAVLVPSIRDRTGREEGTPTVIVEAMAAGARVIATRTGGAADHIRHRDNGWLCREKDPDDLAEKILDALGVPDNSPILAAASRTAAANDWRLVGEQYLGILEDAVSRRRGQGERAGAEAGEVGK